MSNKIIGIFTISLVLIGFICLIEGLYNYISGGGLYYASITSVALTIVLTLAISCMLVYYAILGIKIFKTKD